MTVVRVVSPHVSNRLLYVLDWLFKEILQLEYEIISVEEAGNADTILISYGADLPGSISIPDCGLLWKKSFSPVIQEPGFWNEIPVFFAGSAHYSLPFDFFSAIFYFITRYEEYGNIDRDKHGRFPHEQSLLGKSGLLERPIVDEWIFSFYRILNNKGLSIELDGFSYRATYDIDIAYSYLHKGTIRTAGAFSKDLLHMNVSSVWERLNVLTNRRRDPYDCFDWLEIVHREFNIHPLYFILATQSTTSFDKNIHPQHPAMQQLIRQLAMRGDLGLHPSYFSTTEKIFISEKKVLESIIGEKIVLSRQHYIRLNLPETYRRLITLGIVQDWSMGFGGKLGFRAGTGRPFYWYDLESEKQTGLRVYPFCFMDSTAHFEEKLSPEAAFEKLEAMKQILVVTKSSLVTVFHNFSLGSDPQWKGWKNNYRFFLESIAKEATSFLS